MTALTDAAKLATALHRTLPYLRDEAAKYADDGSNEPLELVRDIEELLDGQERAQPASVPAGWIIEELDGGFVHVESPQTLAVNLGYCPEGNATASQLLRLLACALLESQPAQPASVPNIDTVVTRFLGWRLPNDFAPGVGMTFTPPTDPLCWPTGTDLLNDPQARAMFEYVLAAAPEAGNPVSEGNQAVAQQTDDEIYAEIERAVTKFPTWPTDPLHALAVLGEEYGELTKAVLQATYEPHKNGPGDVRDEAIQTAAMAIRFVRSLMFYQYERCEQHSQAAAAQESGDAT